MVYLSDKHISTIITYRPFDFRPFEQFLIAGIVCHIYGIAQRVTLCVSGKEHIIKQHIIHIQLL